MESARDELALRRRASTHISRSRADARPTEHGTHAKTSSTTHIIWSVSQWTFSVAALPLIVYCMYELLGTAAFVGVGAFLLTNALSAAIVRLQ